MSQQVAIRRSEKALREAQKVYCLKNIGFADAIRTGNQVHSRAEAQLRILVDSKVF